MKAIHIIPIVLTAFLLSCSSDKPKTANSIKDKKNFNVQYSIAEENMYDTTAISKALMKADRHQKTESRKLFLQGLDLLVNKNKPNESIEFFKESILYYPDEKNYQHLFKAYVYSSDTINAQILSQFIETQAPKWGLEYYEIDFNNALIAAVKKDAKLCVMTLSDAMMNGFVFKERITEEPLFKFMDEDVNFQSFIASNFGSDDKINRMLFKAFLEYYPDLALPYSTGIDSIHYFNYDHYIDYNFAIFIPDMNDGRFSRDVTNEYMYVGKTKLENGYAFVYKSFLAIADTLNPVKTFVVTYDTLGKLVSSEMIGCFCSPTEGKTFTINKDFIIAISDYTFNWDFDPIEKGYAGNKVTSTEENKKSILLIDKNGSITEQKDNIASVSTPEKKE